jgi:hypothetical protein
MKWWPVWLLMTASSVLAQTNVASSPVVTFFTSEAPSTNLTAKAIMERALANRPMRDLSLKARLFVTRDDESRVEIFIRNTPDETRTIYRGDKTDLLIVQPVHGAATYYLRGVGQLTEARQTEKLLKSQFSLYDLTFPFMHWPDLKLIGDSRTRGRDCYEIEAKAGNTNAPYAKVKIWIDQTYFGLLRAEGYNSDGALVKRFAVTSFKRVGEIWIPRGIEVASIPVGQAMPAEDRSRLEVYDGNYDAKLPVDMFSELQFGKDR